MDKDDNTIPYKAPIHHLRRLGCFVSRLISAAQRRGKLGPRSKPGCIMEEVHLRVLDTENIEHRHPSRPVGVKETTIIIMKTRVLSQALLATIIIIMKTRALLANTGNSSLKMAAPMGVERPWHH